MKNYDEIEEDLRKKKPLKKSSKMKVSGKSVFVLEKTARKQKSK